MSTFNANSMLPLISALSDTEKHVLLKELEKMLCKKKPKIKAKKNILDRPELFLFRPENKEILVSKIMNGTF